MKYLVIFSLLILTSCSAPWHVRRALKIDPCILTEQADTTFVEKITYRPVKILIHDTIDLNLSSDTIFVNEKIREFKNVEPAFFHSADSIAHAKIWVKYGILHAEIWATVDTSINWKDSVTYLQREIYREKEIRRRTKIEMTEKISFFEKVKIFAVVLFSLLLTIILLFIIKQFKK